MVKEVWPENAFKSVGNNGDNAANLHPDLFDFSLLQPMLDKKVDRPTQDEHIRARARPAEIGQTSFLFATNPADNKNKSKRDLKNIRFENNLHMERLTNHTRMFQKISNDKTCEELRTLRKSIY